MGRDSSVGIATRCGTDGPGIKSVPMQTGPGDQQSSCAMGTGSFPRAKRPGRVVDHLLASSAEVKEGVELHIYSPSGPHGVFYGNLYLYLLPLRNERGGGVFSTALFC